MILSGLQLDDVDVPKRGASRANSVRFDDSATTNHWIHDSPGTSDYFGQRSAGGPIGGYPMTERSSSHKSDQRSDGRQSSLRSFGVDLQPAAEPEFAFRPGSQPGETLEPCLQRPSSTPTGPAPAMIRCWLDTPSIYGPLLYAVVCTGASVSAIERSLLCQLGLEDRVEKPSGREPRIQLSLFLPDANIQQHARASGPAKLARLVVEFVVLPDQHRNQTETDIGIFLGSDILSSHMGDVLFSQSQLMLHVEDGRKVYVPFYRPESKKSFSDIFTVHTDELLDFSNETRKWEKPNGLLAAEQENIQPAEPAQPHPSVSSPRPIQGRQASVIREVAAMGSPDFPPKDSQSLPAVDSNLSSRPWDERKTSFSAEVLNDRSKSAQSTPAESVGNSSETYDAGKMDTEGVTRGRSLTNPYASSGSAGKNYAASVWDGAKKPTLATSTASTPKEGSSTWGSQNRVSSRGMKVLRTSKSFSSTDRGNNQSSAQSEPGSAPIGPPKPSILTTSKIGGKSNHSRAVSGDANSHAKGSLVRTKSSNVVGGASAFHWMAPKNTTATAADDH
jgi:hypothetical protein